MRSGHQRFGLSGWAFAAAWLACLALPAVGQVYTFTSGPAGDGFDWPASPTGLVSFESFFTPDGVDIFNDTSNTVFFDSQYQVVGNGSRISGDALWGNPTDMGFGAAISFDLSGFESLQELDFDFAWSEAGVPAVSDFVSFYAEDSEGRSTFGGWSLSDTFTGFGGSTGYEDHISLSAGQFVDDDNNFDGGPFIDITYFDIFLEDIVTSGPSSEFAIDNLSFDGGGSGSNDVYPSVNGGQFDVTGSILSSSSLRGTGTFARGIEVTNGSGTSTTYSTELISGGALTSGTHPNGDSIGAGQSIVTPDVASVDRSQPSGTYSSDILIINDGDPSDPDNITTLRISLYDSQSLSGNFASVDVSAGQQITLTNAIASVSGFRAAVEVTGSQTSGPFEVTDFAIDTAVKEGETAQAMVSFNRYGQLSGTRTGTHTVSLQQTAFIGVSNDFEIFLANTEPVPDQVWNLNFNHVDTTSDNANISTGFSYFQIVGVNTLDVAATLIDGTSSKNQNVGMQITTDPDPASADLIGEPVDLVFGGGAGDQYVLQLTYDDGSLPGGVTESQLQLLVYDTIAGAWEAAIDGNATGASMFFSGSYEDYLAGPGGGVFDAGDLGAFGVDTLNNHVWAILDHASVFGVGVLTAGLLGDFDGDGDVDGADFLVWQRDPMVGNLSDWQSGYASGGVASAAVPEPTSLTFVVVCLMVISTRSRIFLTR